MIYFILLLCILSFIPTINLFTFPLLIIFGLMYDYKNNKL